MPYIPPQQFRALYSIDLFTYMLQAEPDNLKKMGRHYFHKEFDSLCVSPDTGLWHRQSTGVGGKSAMKFLIEIRGMTPYDAARRLMDCGAAPTQAKPRAAPEQEKTLILPPPNGDNDRVIRYLLGRGIHPAVINHCISAGLLYESYGHRNAVFVCRDRGGVPRYGFLHGTTSQRFVRDAEGSSKRYSFCIPATRPASTLIKTEGAVDVLSLATLAYNNDPDGWTGYHYLSGAGASCLSIERYLTDYPMITNIFLCNDSDSRGRAMTAKQKALYAKKGYKIYDAPPSVNLPHGKDYNDAVRLGIPCPDFPPPVTHDQPSHTKQKPPRDQSPGR